MRRLEQAILYPGVGLLEDHERLRRPRRRHTLSNSVRRAVDRTARPGRERVERRRTPPECGFCRATSRPRSSKFAGERCGGIDVILTDPDGLNAVDVGLTIAATLRRLYPDAWETKRFDRLLDPPAEIYRRGRRRRVGRSAAASVSRRSRGGFSVAGMRCSRTRRASSGEQPPRRLGNVVTAPEVAIVGSEVGLPDRQVRRVDSRHSRRRRPSEFGGGTERVAVERVVGRHRRCRRR